MVQKVLLAHFHNSAGYLVQHQVKCLMDTVCISRIASMISARQLLQNLENLLCFSR